MTVRRYFDLVRAYTATTGAGPVVVGPAVPGFMDFTTGGIHDGDAVSYGLYDPAANGSEVGQGTYSLATKTLSRDTVFASTNSGAAINLSGSAQVFVTLVAEDVTIDMAYALDFDGGNKVSWGRITDPNRRRISRGRISQPINGRFKLGRLGPQP